MEKLLHERLRDWEDKGNGFVAVKVIGGGQIIGRRLAIESLTNEIERYYIPRPRFYDGEPVQFGDYVGDLEGPVNNIEVRLTKPSGVSRASVKTEDVDYWLFDNSEAAHATRFFKRPTPKVYDADGVETKAGDKGWDTKTGCEMTVLFVKPDDREYALFVRCKDGSEIHLQADQFTHERPVFDAEGVRICKGDTVYDVDGINPEPMRVLSYGDALVNVMSKSGIEKSYEFNELTHREPDSLERLRDDIDAVIEMSDGSNVACDRKGLEGVRDRLTALIERGA